MRITTNTVQWDEGTTIQYRDKSGQAGTLDLSAYTDSSFSYDVFGEIKKFIESGTKTPLYAAVIDGSDGELVIGYDPAAQGAAKAIILAQVVAAYDNADRTCSFMFQILDGGTK